MAIHAPVRPSKLPLLAGMRDAHGLPEGATVRVLHPGTDIEVDVYGEDGTVLTQPLIVAGDVPGRVAGHVELVSTWPGGARTRATRRLRDMPRPDPPREITGTPALARLALAPRPEQPRAVSGVSALAHMMLLPRTIMEPRPVTGVPALAGLALMPRAPAPRKVTGVRALTHMMLGLGAPGDTVITDISAVELLTGDGAVRVVIRPPVGTFDGVPDESTGLIEISAGNWGVDGESPYYSPDPIPANQQAVSGWDPQTEMFALSTGGAS